MKKFTKLEGVIAPIKIANVDTDRIIPANFLKAITKTGIGGHLFQNMRYNVDGSSNEDFILNQPAYKNTEIIVSLENFGCGSSREHAAWALADYGIRAVIASSFADIFYNNSFKNGLLLIKLSDDEVSEIIKVAEKPEKITIDLEKENVVAGGKTYNFNNVSPFQKNCLLNGLDDIGLTLQKKDLIDKYEEKQKKDFPWLWSTK
ncbi:MAG: 3-isopropylmalate dehydratase small subunit [Rickettsiales bacterium]|jgi:3-isopropylmalate/(R)-2-methylmalate dehydratase small subunit|nr:3-isopropylmalate dehydratase small subunit [Rickettsiales bacterium]